MFLSVVRISIAGRFLLGSLGPVDRVKRKHEHTWAYVKAHNLAQFLASDVGWVHRFREGET